MCLFKMCELVHVCHDLANLARSSITGFVGRTFSDMQSSVRSAFELTQDAVAASVAVQMSNRARATVLDQWKLLTNVATERCWMQGGFMKFSCEE